MIAIKFLSLRWETLLLRYFLMMFCVIGGVLTKLWFIAFLGLPLFLSAILGVAFINKKKEAKLIAMKLEAKKKRKVS